MTGHYYFSSEKLLNLYAGIGIGATYAKEELYYNTYVSSDYQWGFLVRPKVDVIIKPQLHSNWGILAGARYSYSTIQQDDFDINKLESVELQVGIAWNWLQDVSGTFKKLSLTTLSCFI